MTRAAAHAALDAEGARLERVRDETDRIEQTIERLRLMDALRRARHSSVEITEVIERAALRDDVRSLSEAQVLIKNLRSEMEALQLRIAELESERHIDPLTGVKDRAGFAEALEREWARSMRGKQPIGLLFVDVDRFKDVNDRFGHQGGDEALKAIVGAIDSEARRSGELVARYGGDEFVVVVPQTPLPGVLALGERIRGAVSTLRLRIGDQVAPLSVSIGAGAMQPSFGVTSDELVRRADRAVYRAKEAGRGRAVAMDVQDGRDVYFTPDLAAAQRTAVASRGR